MCSDPITHHAHGQKLREHNSIAELCPLSQSMPNSSIYLIILNFNHQSKSDFRSTDVLQADHTNCIGIASQKTLSQVQVISLDTLEKFPKDRKVDIRKQM